MYEINKLASAEDFEGLSFVLKAMGKDETRSFLQVIHVERYNQKRVAVATDSKRLHYATIISNIPEGDYQPVISKNSLYLKPLENASFPNWKRVIPKLGTELATIDLYNTAFGKKESQTALMSKAIISLYTATHRVVNACYLDDLSKAAWKVFAATGDTKAVVFKRELKEGEQSAVIMPMEMAA